MTQGNWIRAVGKRRQTLHSGFTLVEMLVVIGIITLLIAMLMPSLTKARRQALRVACAANLEQIGQALLMYANDNRGYLPSCSFRGDLSATDPKSGLPAPTSCGGPEGPNGNFLVRIDANGQYEYPERLGMLLDDWTQFGSNYINPPQAYLKNRQSLFCPGKNYEAWDAGVINVEQCGYSYCIPMSGNFSATGVVGGVAGSSGSGWWPLSWKPHEYIFGGQDWETFWNAMGGKSLLGDYQYVYQWPDGTYGNGDALASPPHGPLNPRYDALVACMYETQDWAPSDSNFYLANLPHNNEGINILYYDGSVRFMLHPHDGWPHPGWWTSSEFEMGNEYSSEDFWWVLADYSYGQ